MDSEPLVSIHSAAGCQHLLYTSDNSVTWNIVYVVVHVVCFVWLIVPLSPGHIVRSRT
jgi:hypothetical protein